MNGRTKIKVSWLQGLSADAGKMKVCKEGFTRCDGRADVDVIMEVDVEGTMSKGTGTMSKGTGKGVRMPSNGGKGNDDTGGKDGKGAGAGMFNAAIAQLR